MFPGDIVHLFDHVASETPLRRPRRTIKCVLDTQAWSLGERSQLGVQFKGVNHSVIRAKQSTGLDEVGGAQGIKREQKHHLGSSLQELHHLMTGARNMSQGGAIPQCSLQRCEGAGGRAVEYFEMLQRAAI